MNVAGGESDTRQALGGQSQLAESAVRQWQGKHIRRTARHVSRSYFLNRAALWTWYAHEKLWVEPKHIYFSPGFVALLDLRWNLSSPTRHYLCGIQACSVTCRRHVHVQSSATQQTCLYTRPSHWARPCLFSGKVFQCNVTSNILSSWFPIDIVHRSWHCWLFGLDLTLINFNQLIDVLIITNLLFNY